MRWIYTISYTKLIIESVVSRTANNLWRIASVYKNKVYFNIPVKDKTNEK